MVARVRRTRTASLVAGTAVVLCVVISSLGCSAPSGPLGPGVSVTTGAVSTAQSVSTTGAVSVTDVVSTTAGTPTSVSSPTFSVDDIQAKYVYTTNLITILYPLYGSKLDDFVDVTLTNNGAVAAKVVVKSEVVGFTTPAIDTVEVPAGGTLEVGQNPLLISSVIDSLNVEKPASVRIQVAALKEGEEKTILDETAETTVLARRDFPLAIPGFTAPEVLDFFAAMITPNDPSVEELIRKAADYTDSGIMWSGYGGHVGDDDGGVWDRLQAVWQAEKEYNLTYVSTWVSFAPGEVQRIRLPFEVLDQHSGNCIELAMLYASAAEAMDLEAALILIPGHAYVGIRTDQENADYYFVETTMIGQNSFSQAVDKAKAEFDDALPHISAEESGYGWVKIWDARADGILPLPWH